MSQALSENGSTPDIRGLLKAYEEMSVQRERYASLKENVEKERRSVQLHIYERVKTEYEDKMRSVEQDLEKQKELLEGEIQKLLDKRADLNKLCQKDTERLEEIVFRTRVGEFTDEECKAERGELEQRTKSQSEELTRLDEIIERCGKAGLLAEPEPSPGSAPAPEETREEPEAEGSHLHCPQALTAEDPPADPEPAQRGAPEPAEEENFEIVEDDPPGGTREAPIVHCPPELSSGGPPARRDTAAGTSRPGPHVEISEYVTGYLIALEGSRQGERFPMISSNITLGSSPGIDIRLSDSGIANFHARILYKERKHFLENLDGMGRSFVNGVQATDIVELKDGDVIRLGDIKMQVEYASAQAVHAN